MNVGEKILLYLLFILFSVSIQAQGNKSILLLNSYHNGYRWTDELTEGVKEAVGKRQNTTLFVGYLDAKRNPGFYESNIFKEAFAKKYNGKRFDIVIVSDNAALDFLLENRDMPCWKNAKYISTGVTNYEEYLNIPDLYIVTETSTFDNTFKYIFRFFPKTNELVFITDTLQTGKIYINEVSGILNNKHPGVKLTVLHDFTLQTLPTILKRYKYPAVIYTSTTTVNRNGDPINEFDVARIVKENANVPSFSGLYCERVGGFIGGVYTAGYENGLAGGRVALMIINNNPKLEKVTYPPVKTVFDYQELKKHNVPEKLIPADATVFNKPVPFFEKNKNVLIITGIIIINLLIVIAFFVYLWLTQKQHKKQLVKAVSQAQEANKLKTVFLENVSHEMRTPLNSIIGFSDVLSEMITKPTEKQYLKIISDNALDLYNLISNIFNFSLLKSHKVSLNFSTISPSHLIEEILNESYLKQKIEEGNVNLDLNFEQNETHIKTDKEKLYQVLKSTIHNAFKYTNEGTITIKYRLTYNNMLSFNEAKLHSNQKPTHILFKIKDTGIGITPEELEFIFEPFRQADEKDTNANRGLGLGLSISKSIIEIMGGRLKIKSQPGKGAGLYFTIPVEPTKAKKYIGSY